MVNTGLSGTTAGAAVVPTGAGAGVAAVSLPLPNERAVSGVFASGGVGTLSSTVSRGNQCAGLPSCSTACQALSSSALA